MEWDIYFLEMAKFVSQKSKDRSTKVGAVIVGPENVLKATGFNGFPRGIDDTNEEYHERPLKYRITEHAERNAIYNAARDGVAVKGSVMYLTCGAIACTDCARAIIQAGIIAIVGYEGSFEGKGDQWKEDLGVASAMLTEAGIKMFIIDKPETRETNE